MVLIINVLLLRNIGRYLVLEALDKPVANEGQKVKVIILLPDDDEIDDASRLKVIQGSEAFDFLADEAEDIYTIADGKPVSNEA